jgi:undecaprenyl-diphosphatase
MDRLWLALVVGVLQGVFEWLPVSSEGNIALYLTVIGGMDPAAATGFSLFLHAGTAVAATAYYREDVLGLARQLPAALRQLPASVRHLSPGHSDRTDAVADVLFLGVATLASGVVGIAAYLTLMAAVSAIAGGVFVALVGVLLVATGAIQRLAATRLGDREAPTLLDAVLVGVLQGLAILPGVSRSGTTVSALLLRGYDAAVSFRLSFLLSIPASLGAGLLIVLDDGLPDLPLAAALAALAVAAVVGYLTIDALLRVVERVAFWAVCVGLGALAILGGALAAV